MLSSLRKRILEVAYNAGDAHVPSALSIIDIIDTLYLSVLGPHDQFVLSKGHGCLALYAVLEREGAIPSQWLDRFCKPGAELLGHPERRPNVGIHCTTGSLGHGLAMAAGMALGKKIKNLKGRVFCLVGDGELEEGSCYEALLLASRLKLSNLVCIVDNNHSSPNQVDGIPYQNDLGSKFAAFGWGVYKCDGHEPSEIIRCCVASGDQLPRAVIARTIKGKGIPEMEAEPQAWHRRKPTAEMVAA